MKKKLKQPVFSVIVPAFNEEKYIKECLDSLASQTLDKTLFEVIVINDCSTDKTLDIVNNYTKLTNLQTATNRVNKGLGYSRNIGISKAKGKYLVFLDSDDLLVSNALKILHKRVELLNPDLIVYNWEYYHHIDKKNCVKTKNGSFDVIPKTPEEAIDYCLSLRGIDFTGNYKTAKRELFYKYNLSYSKGLHEDIAMTLKMFYYANSLEIVKDIVYIRRVREGSITHSFDKRHIEGLFKAWDEMLNFALSVQSGNKTNIKRYYLYGISGIIANIIKKISKIDDPRTKDNLYDILYQKIISNGNIDIDKILDLQNKTFKTKITIDFIKSRGSGKINV